MNLKQRFNREGERNTTQELDDLVRYLNSGVDYLMLKKRNAAPEKPRVGMVVLADGTNWNPGSGAGFYGYNAGSWVKLG
jgi:hypothetical protein